MKVIILFDADDEQPDPERGHGQGGQHYELIGDNTDVFVAWREWGEQFEGGYVDHTTMQGVWEHLTQSQVDSVVAVLSGMVVNPDGSLVEDDDEDD